MGEDQDVINLDLDDNSNEAEINIIQEENTKKNNKWKRKDPRNNFLTSSISSTPPILSTSLTSSTSKLNSNFSNTNPSNLKVSIEQSNLKSRRTKATSSS